MGILYNGNAWDSQYALSGTLSVVNGLNVGASGVVFVLPSGLESSTKQIQVAAVAGSVSVSGTAPNTINGSSNPVAVNALVGKTFYNYSGSAWISL